MHRQRNNLILKEILRLDMITQKDSFYISNISFCSNLYYSGLLNICFLLNILEFEQIRQEQALQLPLKPPHSRKWRGSIVAPFGGNNMLVLYSCPANNSSKYLVQVLHNEHPVPLPVSFLLEAYICGAQMQPCYY